MTRLRLCALVVCTMGSLVACRALLDIEEKSLVVQPLEEAGTTDASEPVDQASEDACPIPTNIRCNGVCADLRTDGTNCGRCGRTCSCDDGRCVAKRLITFPTTPTSLVESAGALFTNAGQVFRLAKDGAANAPISTSQSTTVDVAVLEPYVYWTEMAGNVSRTTSVGGSAFPVVSGHPGASRLALDVGEVFFTRELEPGDIFRVGQDGGTAPSLVIEELRTPRHIVVDATKIYFTMHGDPDRGLWRVDKGGGTKVRVHAGELVGLAIDDEALYTADLDRAAILRIPKSGGELVTLASGQTAGGIGVDFSFVYWSAGNGQLFRVAKNGGQAEAVAVAQGAEAVGAAGPVAATDAQAVYWVSGRAVFRADK
jgi:hypothetical protein